MNGKNPLWERGYNMEWRQILYFIEVAKHEHVTEAANHLHVAQSAVSRQIGLLEAELGTPLFTREGRNVKLTSIGRIFRSYAENAVLEIQQGKEKIEEYLNPEQGVIHLGLGTGLSAHTLPVALSQFREQHPGINFQLYQGSHRYLIDLIEKGRLDIAFCAPVPKEHADVTGHIFYREQMLAILPIQHNLSEQTFLRLDQLRDEPFVAFRKGLALHESLMKACEQSGFQPQLAFEGEDIETIKALVSAGFGVALLPEHGVIDLPPDLVKKTVTKPELYRSVGVVIPKRRELGPSESLLLEFLKSFYDRLSRFGE
jgi:LysR family transcriptional regulator, transcription activator of glutamate synthase operon